MHLLQFERWSIPIKLCFIYRFNQKRDKLVMKILIKSPGIAWLQAMNLKDSKLPWQHTNVTSCSHKVHVQSAVLQYCNICCDLLLVCGVASWLADVSWWAQRKSHKFHSFQLSVPLHIITVWRLYCCLCSSSDVVHDNPQTLLHTSTLFWQDDKSKTATKDCLQFLKEVLEKGQESDPQQLKWDYFL